MKVGDLFAGIGGFSLGLEWAGMQTAWQVESDPFCQKVLAKHWPNVTRYGDIYEFNELAEAGEVQPVDVIAGGFPCQPFSQAGNRKSESDDRYLWPAMLKTISTLRPTWVIGENVAGIIRLALDQVLSDLENEGYSAQAFIIPACGLNAPHRRERVWIVGHSERKRCEKFNLQRPRVCVSVRSGQDVADACQQGLQRRKQQGTQAKRPRTYGSITKCGGRVGEQWQAEPAVGRVANGIPRRVDRLKALGNAVVPQIPYVIGQAIMEAEE